MPARHIGKAEVGAPPTAGHLVAAGVQLVNEIVRQLQARPVQEDGDVRVKLARRIARLRERNQALEECIVFLSSAFGMCPACFGKVPECPACRGQGQPGNLSVDPAAFAEIVAPLFQKQPERLDDVIRRPTLAEVERAGNGSPASRIPTTP